MFLCLLGYLIMKTGLQTDRSCIQFTLAQAASVKYVSLLYV